MKYIPTSSLMDLFTFQNAFPVSGQLYTTHLLSLDALLTVIDSTEAHCQAKVLNTLNQQEKKETARPGFEAVDGSPDTYKCEKRLVLFFFSLYFLSFLPIPSPLPLPFLLCLEFFLSGLVSCIRTCSSFWLGTQPLLQYCLTSYP